MPVIDIWQKAAGIRLPVYQPGWQTPIIDGQSLALGFDGSSAEEKRLRYMDRLGLRQLTGMQRSDGAAVWLHGPGTMTYNAAPSTGLIYAGPNGNAPMCFTFAVALDRWRIALGVAPTKMVVGFNGIAGQSVVEFNDDSPVVDGSLGTLIRDNHIRWLNEALASAPGLAPLFYALVQGEANVSMTQAEYYAAASDTTNDALDDIQAILGVRPPLAVFQVGGYRDSTTDSYGPPLAQMQMVDEGAVFLGPIYPGLLHDNVHPTLNAQLLSSEAGAYIWARREQGARVDMTPLAPQVVGNQITIPFRTEPGKGVAFDTGKYDAYGGLVDHGIEVSGTAISDITISGSAVVVTAGAALSGRTLSIAMQAQNMTAFSDGQGAGYAGHRCDIMEADPVDSRMVPGAKLKRFIPSLRFQL